MSGQARRDRIVASPTTASVADDLQQLRREAGGMSYADIAARVSRLRAERSSTTHTALVARSTVYDAFRADRKRLDADLIVDIVRVLGGSDADLTAWRRRCAQPDSTSLPASMPSPAPPATSTSFPRRWSLRDVPRPALIAMLLVIAVAANVLGGQIVWWLDLPLYLDMIGTAIAAIVIGPWYGVAVAIVTQFTGAAIHGTPIGLPFTIVSVVGALLWGYGVRSWGMGRSALRFFALCIGVAVACTIVAAPITVLVYGGFAQHVAGEALTARMLLLGTPLWAAVFSSNLVTSLFDKLIAGFIALTIGHSLTRHVSAFDETPPDPAGLARFAGILSAPFRSRLAPASPLR